MAPQPAPETEPAAQTPAHTPTHTLAPALATLPDPQAQAFQPTPERAIDILDLAARAAAELFPEATPETIQKARAMAEIARPHIQSKWGRPAHERRAMIQKMSENARRNAEHAAQVSG